MVALIEVEELKGEADEVAREAFAIGEEDEYVVVDADANGDTPEMPNGITSADSADVSKIPAGKETDEVRNRSNPDSTLASTTSSNHSTDKFSKIQILEMRAEAMAKLFAEEICGSEFRMPAEFR